MAHEKKTAHQITLGALSDEYNGHNERVGDSGLSLFVHIFFPTQGHHGNANFRLDRTVDAAGRGKRKTLLFTILYWPPIISLLLILF